MYLPIRAIYHAALIGVHLQQIISWGFSLSKIPSTRPALSLRIACVMNCCRHLRLEKEKRGDSGKFNAHPSMGGKTDGQMKIWQQRALGSSGGVFAGIKGRITDGEANLEISFDRPDVLEKGCKVA